MLEGKHHTNIIHVQSLLELMIVYKDLIISITGQDLWTMIKDNMKQPGTIESRDHGTGTTSNTSYVSSQCL